MLMDIKDGLCVVRSSCRFAHSGRHGGRPFLVIHNRGMVVLMAALLVKSWLVVDGTQSRSKHFAMAWGIPGIQLDAVDWEKTLATLSEDQLDHARNYLVDTDRDRVICLLPSLHYFENENHGGMQAIYTRDESLALVTWEGKWTPRGMELVDTEAGKTRAIWASLEASCRAYVARHPGRYKRGELSSLAYDVDSSNGKAITLRNTELRIPIAGAIPKEESDRGVDLVATYSIGGNKQGIVLKLKGIGKS
jgi:hypothetical protein